MYFNEDMLTLWVKNRNGLLITRSQINLKTFNFNINKPIISIITGYKQITTDFFTKIIKKIKNKVLLIIIESDVIYLQNEWLDNKKLIHCYTWNKPFEHKKLSGIPIGLNFKRHYRPLLNWIKNNNVNEKTQNKSKRLLCFNCSLNTSKERLKLKNVIDKHLNNECDKLEYIPPSKSYVIPSYIEGKIRIDETNARCYDDWIKYKFILSPEGAGLDCHRTWEALMIGCIPIVKNSMLNELYENLPIVIINEWDELNEEFLNKKYIEILENKKNNKYNYNKLYLNYWTNVFEEKINKNIKNIEKPLLLQKNDIHFITYGDNKYEKAKQRILKQAEDFGIFKSIKGFGYENLTEKFKEKYKDILNMPRGGGYWLWKLDIIKQTLNKINENDFIVYLDAGCHLNKSGMNRFNEYINMFNNNEYGILSFQMIDQLEKWWTTSQILEYFNINNKDKDKIILETGQYVGGVLIMRKNEHLLNYINEFENCIEKDKYLITDKYNKINQASYFKDNRHDQSISSILRKKLGSIVIPNDESWKPPFGNGKSLKYPFWATRSKL
jgi:hypothetical protein